MRLQLYTLVLPLVLIGSVYGESSVTQDPPNLKPLISRANVLLTAGQFHDAAKSLTEAIEISPADYTLYYKRATAYYSLNRHSAALDDIEAVLRMTEGAFHQAYVMQANIYAKEGDWSKARKVLKQYTSKAGKNDKEAVDLVGTPDTRRQLNTET